jgi:hypothetical protein
VGVDPVAGVLSLGACDSAVAGGACGVGTLLGAKGCCAGAELLVLSAGSEEVTDAKAIRPKVKVRNREIFLIIILSFEDATNV